MDRRTELLVEYLREVAKDPLMRAAIRKRMGHDPIEILLSEPGFLIGALWRDIKAAGYQVGGELRNGFIEGVSGAVLRFLTKPGVRR